MARVIHHYTGYDEGQQAPIGFILTIILTVSLVLLLFLWGLPLLSTKIG